MSKIQLATTEDIRLLLRETLKFPLTVDQASRVECYILRFSVPTFLLHLHFYMSVISVHSWQQLHLRYGWRQQGPCGSGWATLCLWSVAPRAGHAPRWPGNAKAPPYSWLPKRRMGLMSSRWKHTNVQESGWRIVSQASVGCNRHRWPSFLSGPWSIRKTRGFTSARQKTVKE